MKVIALNGSPRKKGNCYTMIQHCFSVLEQEGIETEIIQVGGTPVKPCRECNGCRKSGVTHCLYNDDPLNQWLDAMAAADGIILASPTFGWAPTPEMKCVLDRIGYIIHQRCNLGEVNPLRRKVGAAISVDGNDGAVQTVQAMQRLFLFSQMFVAGAVYWPVCRGFKPGDCMTDARGVAALEDLGHNIAWFLKATHE